MTTDSFHRSLDRAIANSVRTCVGCHGENVTKIAPERFKCSTCGITYWAKASGVNEG